MASRVVTSAARRIAAVDDDASVLEVVERALTSAGFTVASYPDPARLLTEARGPDVLLSGMQLPSTSALELVRAARASWPDLPVLIMTSKGTLGAAVEAVRHGAHGYVLKPFEPLDALLVAVEQALAHAELVARNRHLEERLAQVDGSALASWNDARLRFEAGYLARVLAASEGNLSHAARLAGLDRSNFKRLLKRHGLLKAVKG